MEIESVLEQQAALPFSAEEVGQMSGLFAVLSDKTRLEILLRLSAGERNVTSLYEAMNLPQPAVSHHLGLLRAANLVRTRREGKQIFYGVSVRVDAFMSPSMSALHVRGDQFEIAIRQR